MRSLPIFLSRSLFTRLNVGTYCGASFNQCILPLSASRNTFFLLSNNVRLSMQMNSRMHVATANTRVSFTNLSAASTRMIVNTIVKNTSIAHGGRPGLGAPGSSPHTAACSDASIRLAKTRCIVVPMKTYMMTRRKTSEQLHSPTREVSRAW